MPEQRKALTCPGRSPTQETSVVAKTNPTAQATPTVVLALPETPLTAQAYRLL
jgi:hypothetical protein